MNRRHLQIGLSIILVSTYLLIFYFDFTNKYRPDFTAFYSASLALIAGANPYLSLLANYLPKPVMIGANLNPPIVLLIFSPVAHLGYYTSLAIWSFISIILSLIGAGISFKLTFSSAFLKKYQPLLYLIYLSLFATLMNTAVAQLGSVLLFFLMLGYYFYLKDRDILAGLTWGFIIAAKLFPGLLFFFALKQRRYKLVFIMAGSFFIAWLIPLIIYGSRIYTQYFSMMHYVLWYGDSWNGSVYGFIFRLFIDAKDSTQSLWSIQLLYICLFSLLLFWYLLQLKKSNNHKTNHQPFCLSLVMMLILSPFGWLYYFPMLCFPLTLSWLNINNNKTLTNKIRIYWLFSLFLINFPMDYLHAHKMPYFIDRFLFYSFYFFGLLLLAYTFSKQKNMTQGALIPPEKNDVFILSILVILFFEFSALFINLIKQLISFN